MSCTFTLSTIRVSTPCARAAPLARSTSGTGDATLGMRVCRIDEHPDSVRCLARHAVDLQRAEKADDGALISVIGVSAER